MGSVVGSVVGSWLGSAVGTSVGSTVGSSVGSTVGAIVNGCAVGVVVGENVHWHWYGPISLEKLSQINQHRVGILAYQRQTVREGQQQSLLSLWRQVMNCRMLL